MLMEKLYTLNTLDYDNSSGIIKASVALNLHHPVFEGHFPGNPILPGVCTLQIAKELISKSLQNEYRLARSSNIKYLGFVSPVATPEISYTISVKLTETGQVTGSVTVTAGEKVVCSFKGDYVQI